jgi:DNA end-binding protein Ku
MAARAIASGTISFGMVSIPVKFYTAAASNSISFNLLHEKCGSRIKQQQFCPVCNEVLQRSDIVRGYEFAKNQYVRFEADELKALEEEASKIIELEEFVPLNQVDPIYFEKAYYLGPDKGGEKAYRLLTDAMSRSGKVALAKHVMRGKEGLVLIRPSQDGLMLHSMYYADEVRDFSELDRGETAKIKDGELDLAVRLIEELANQEFRPENFHDEYRARVLDLVQQKVEGKEITATEPVIQQAQVIDLMDALKASLEKRDRPRKSGRDKTASLTAKADEAAAEDGEMTFEDFQAIIHESNLELGASELQRSFNGLNTLKKRKKLAAGDVRGKVANLRQDLDLVQSQTELLGGRTRKLKAARIPLTARDWERY